MSKWPRYLSCYQPLAAICSLNHSRKNRATANVLSVFASPFARHRSQSIDIVAFSVCCKFTNTFVSFRGRVLCARGARPGHTKFVNDRYIRALCFDYFRGQFCEEF